MVLNVSVTKYEPPRQNQNSTPMFDNIQMTWLNYGGPEGTPLQTE